MTVVNGDTLMIVRVNDNDKAQELLKKEGLILVAIEDL